MNIFQSISEILLANPLNFVFIITMLLLLLLHYNPVINTFVITKSTFLTLGTLGTFLGIMLGLWEFDTNNIDSSIPKLLEGLKLAFITSIAGIIASFCCSSSKKQEYSNDIPTLLQEIVKSTDSISIEIKKSHYIMEKSISLVLTDLNKFADAISKSSTEAIVKALQGVVNSFNEKITSQFGENFKHLNQGIGRILEWQEKYKTHIEVSQFALSNTIKVLKESSEHLESIHKNTIMLPHTIEQLAYITDKSSYSVETLTEQLKAFSDMKENALQAMPFIETQLQNLTSNLSLALQKAVHSTEEEVQNLIKHSKEINTKVMNSVEDITEETKTQITNSSKEIEGLMNNIFQEYHKNLQTQITDILTNIAGELAGIAEHLLENILKDKQG